MKHLTLIFRWSIIAVLTVILAALPGLTGLTQAQDGSDVVPPEVAANLSGWVLPNKDYANTRATFESEIDSSNVRTLGMGWSYEFTNEGSTFGKVSTNPIVAGDIVYAQDLDSNIYAFDTMSGELLWRRDFNMPNIGPNGVVPAYDKLYFPEGADTITAINAESGDEVWSTNLRTQNESEGITIQPVVYDGMVYVSTVPGSSNQNFYQGGVAGIIYALDAETGDIAWSFNTIDSEDLWGNPEINSGGGVWYPPSFNLETGMSYWPVANPAPWPGTEEFPNGSSRPGPNLYSNTLVALDHATGELAWYNQVLPHDLFDLDLQISPILTTTSVHGEEQPVVITAGKMGTVYAMNQESGDLLWETDVGVHQNDRVDAIPAGEKIEVYPGALGGVETNMAYADGVVYVPLLNLPGEYTPTMFDGSSLAVSEGTGELVAIDVNTGAIIWKHNFDSVNVGAATVVNDLVFTATFDGMIHAFYRPTGDLVWSFQAPAGVNGWPAVVGDTIYWPTAAFGDAPSLIALRLGQTEGEPVDTETLEQEYAEAQQIQTQGEGP